MSHTAFIAQAGCLFLFYVNHVIQVHFPVFIVTHNQGSMESVIPLNPAILTIDREGEPGVISIPSQCRVSVMLFAVILAEMSVGGNPYYFREPLRRIDLRFRYSSFKFISIQRAREFIRQILPYVYDVICIFYPMIFSHKSFQIFFYIIPVDHAFSRKMDIIYDCDSFAFYVFFNNDVPSHQHFSANTSPDGTNTVSSPSRASRTASGQPPGNSPTGSHSGSRAPSWRIWRQSCSQAGRFRPPPRRTRL